MLLVLHILAFIISYDTVIEKPIVEKNKRIAASIVRPSYTKEECMLILCFFI